jgi:tetratricopeptide (TPR) repeat protein
MALSLLFIQLPAHADILHLRNGKKIECTEISEEGNLVRYKVPGGTMTIPRAMVMRIERTETPIGQTEPETSLSPQTSSTPKTEPTSEEIADIKKKIQTDPTAQSQLAALYTGMGLSRIEKKDFDGALQNFKKAYELDKTKNATLNLALMYFYLKDDWNAEHYFAELLESNPKDLMILNYLGEIAWRNEDLIAAQNYWQRSLEAKHDKEIEGKLRKLKKEREASESYENSVSRHFMLRYDGGTADSRLVGEISEFLEQTYQELSNQLDVYPDRPFIVVLYPQKDFFNITDAPFWSGGVYDGKIKLPIRGLTSVTDELRSVLTHELAHSFVDIKTSGNCPSWLHEGIAQYLEGKSLDDNTQGRIENFLERNGPINFSELTGRFSGADFRTAAVLYAVSLSFTEFLIQRYQLYQLDSLLEALGNGTSLSEAIEKTYLQSLTQLEQQWRENLRTEHADSQ